MILLALACTDYNLFGRDDAEAGPGPAPGDPAIEVSPSFLDLGAVARGQSSPTQEVRVDSVGEAPLDLIAVELEGPFDVVFPGGTTLQPGEGLDLLLSFTPQARGVVGDTLTVQSGDPERPEVEVALSGTGLEGDISLSPSSHDFGTLDWGGVAAVDLTVSNGGDAALAVSAVEYAGSADLALDVREAENGPLPWVLGPGESRVVQVAYAPSDEGADEGTLSVVSDDPDAPVVAAQLQGAGGPEPVPVCTAFDDFSTWTIGGSGNWTATGTLTENRSGAYASIATLPDQGSAQHFALQVDTAWRGSLNDFAGLVFGAKSGDEYWVVRWDDPNGSYGRYSPTGAIDLSWCSYGTCTTYLRESAFDLYWPADGSFVTWSADVDRGHLTVVWNGLTVVDQDVPELVGVGPGPVGLYSNDNDGGIIYDNFCVLVDP